MTTREVSVKPYRGGLLTYTDTGETVGYLFSHRGDDSPTTPGTYTLGHGLTGAYAPTGYVGKLSEDVVRAHNEALTTLEANAIMEGLPERIAAYWVSGVAGYWGQWSPVFPSKDITLWNGRKIGRVLWRGKKSSTLGGASRQWLRVVIGKEGDGEAIYGGYATSTRDLVYLKRLKGVG